MKSSRGCPLACVTSLLVLSCISFAGPKKESQGEVADAAGLLKVRTFCLDASQFTPQQTGALKRFVAEARKPKGIFAKLNWQLVDNCRSADATVQLVMLEHKETEAAGSGTVSAEGATGALVSNLRVQVLSQTNVRVSENARATTLYHANGAVRRDEVSALESPFTKLLKDLKDLPH